MSGMKCAYQESGVIPRFYLENVGDAAGTARAMLAGEVCNVVMDVRGEGLLAIETIRREVPEMTVGACAIHTSEELRAAVKAGAQFVMLCEFSEAMISEAKELGVEVIVHCETLSEVIQARDLGADGAKIRLDPAKSVQEQLKPYRTYLSEPFLVPAEITDPAVIGELTASPVVASVETDWIRTMELRTVENTCRELHAAVLGFTFAHVGINCPDIEGTRAVSGRFTELFGFPATDNPRGNSFYSTSSIEVMKFMQLGTHGHLGIRTNSAARAAEWLEKKGVKLRHGTEKYVDGRLSNIYLEEEIGGFAVHLLQKR
ncbi:MAG: bifunctional 4-hydroxy-2-oxoglutarate aldolase/2-dehydro-3-deoxy-phosphogluconate aldolase [Lachnospiraceae bacterium]|nr:bifunctional 4-hydroxy-2-oxoglutarate aldolase/2-dehydro-3-deoxy-phosphogluconate aldolase [Lachnospiraceae bacterium]